MKVFITWSGEASHRFALELQNLLRQVFPAILPFVSSEDIKRGTHWGPALTDALTSSHCGIVCLTSENLNEPWVLFETGVLTRTASKRVYPVLIGGLLADDLERSPLSQFQSTRFVEREFYALLSSINIEMGAGAYSASDLQTRFAGSWASFQRGVADRLHGVRPVVTVADLVRKAQLRDGSPIIAGMTFHSLEIQGPAIFAILNDCSIERCQFMAPYSDGSPDMDGIFWRPVRSGYVVGAVGITHCTFDDCVFTSIGFAGPDYVLERLRETRPRLPTSTDCTATIPANDVNDLRGF